VSRLASQPLTLRLLADAIRVAQDAVSDEKLAVLAEALAHGAAGEALDREHLLVAALADLEVPHLSLLDTFASTSADVNLRWGGKMPAANRLLSTIRGDELPAARPDLAPYLDALLPALLRHGLIVEVPAPTCGLTSSQTR
jgi:hypothetical protein